MKKQSGFTLIELMIVVAIVAILAAIAMPAYQGYTARAKFSDVINAAGSVKTQVEMCYNENNGLDACDNGGSGYGWKIAAKEDYANTNTTEIEVANGVITGKASGATNITGKTYILTPASSAAGLKWTVSGSCKIAELCTY